MRSYSTIGFSLWSKSPTAPSISEQITGTIGCTPLVRLNKVVPFENAQIFAKLEWYNPFGAVKDRLAANMVRDAEERGVLGSGNKLVEPTSGNTGLALAMIGNAKGYSLQTPKGVCPNQPPEPHLGQGCSNILK